MSRSALLALCAAALLAGAAGAAPVARAAAAAPQGAIVRLHIIANSNSDQDIAAKVAVRDALWNYLDSRLATPRSAASEAAILRSLTPAMQRIARSTLSGYGLHYGASVRLGTANLPARTYLGDHLAAGRYVTLLVVLGQGKGQNWWCLLFPQLCFADQGSAVGYSERGTQSPTGFQALAKVLLPAKTPLIRPGGLLYSFWRHFYPQQH